MGYSVFGNCEALTSATIPDSVTMMDRQTFEYCRGLQSVVMPSGMQSIPDGTFLACDALSNIAFSPNTATSGSVVIPNTVTSIGPQAFSGCLQLMCVSLPSSITNIGDSAFYGCANLTSTTVQGSPSVLGANSFGECPSLTAVVFLDNAPASASETVFSENSSAIVYRLSNKSGWSTSFAGRPTALIDCLFTEQQFRDGASGYTSGRSEGRNDVTTNPSAFNLFTQGQFNNNRAAGQTDVINNPTTYGLYNSNSIMDLRMGGLMIQRQGTNAVVSFQPQTTTDLSLPFTNNGTPITNTIPMHGNKGFIRINAKP